jgi:hypothetical protein
VTIERALDAQTLCSNALVLGRTPGRTLYRIRARRPGQ